MPIANLVSKAWDQLILYWRKYTHALPIGQHNRRDACSTSAECIAVLTVAQQ